MAVPILRRLREKLADLCLGIDPGRPRSRPAFLVGSQRSGTNMVAWRLGRSPEVELYNEDHPHAFEDYHLRDLRTVDWLVRRSYFPVVLFKSLNDTWRTDQLLERFPQARALFLFRHYRAVVASGLREFGDAQAEAVRVWVETGQAPLRLGTPLPPYQALLHRLYRPDLDVPSLTALFWFIQNGFFFDLGLDREERLLPVPYEEVVADPPVAFRRICAFLGIRYQGYMIDGVGRIGPRPDPQIRLDPEVEGACQALWARLRPHAWRGRSWI